MIRADRFNSLSIIFKYTNLTSNRKTSRSRWFTGVWIISGDRKHENSKWKWPGQTTGTQMYSPRLSSFHKSFIEGPPSKISGSSRRCFNFNLHAKSGWARSIDGKRGRREALEPREDSLVARETSHDVVLIESGLLVFSLLSCRGGGAQLFRRVANARKEKSEGQERRGATAISFPPSPSPRSRERRL